MHVERRWIGVAATTPEEAVRGPDLPTSDVSDVVDHRSKRLPGCGKRRHCYAALFGGRWLCRQRLARSAAAQAPRDCGDHLGEIIADYRQDLAGSYSGEVLVVLGSNPSKLVFND